MKQKLTKELENYGAIGPEGQLLWIDEEDKLQTNRNYQRVF